jgi:DNA (cytosine-5)-methyltransferase 1
VSINRERRKLVIDGAPDDNCPICWRIADQENAKHWNALKDDQSIEIGIAYLGQKYHFDDFILYRSKLKGPANIGHIIGFKFPKNQARNSSVIVTVKRLGRMTDLAKIAPPYMLRHEVRKCHL